MTPNTDKEIVLLNRTKRGTAILALVVACMADVCEFIAQRTDNPVAEMAMAAICVMACMIAFIADYESNQAS